MSSDSPLNTALIEKDAEELTSVLPDFPLTSRNAIMAFYGALEVAAEGLDPVSDEAFLTPKRIASLDPEEWIVLSLDIDLTNLEDPDYRMVSTHSLTDTLAGRLGLARYAEGKRDHSITNVGKKSTTSVSTASGYLHGRVNKWPARPPIAETAKGHSDGTLIQALETLSQNVSKTDIEQDVREVYEGNQQVITTVRLQIDLDDFGEEPSSDVPDEWYLPGEIPVFVSAAANRSRSKLTEKNVSGTSSGVGVCSIENMETKVIGAIEDPIKLYRLQHSDEFLRFNDDKSWRHNPVAARNGPLIGRADPFLEGCYWQVGGLRVYALPYFAGQQTYKSAVITHEILRRIQDADWDEKRDAENQMVRAQLYVETHFEELAQRLRFYFITLRTDTSGVRVFYEEPSVSALPLWDASEKYAKVREQITGQRSGFTPREGWELLEPNYTINEIADQILSRSYAQETLLEPYPNASDYKDAASDPREKVTYAILTRGGVDPEWLLKQYVRRLDHNRTEHEADTDAQQQKLKQQFIQYQSLASAGAIKTPSDTKELATPPTYMTGENSQQSAISTDGGTTDGYVETLNRQLDEFLARHPVLDNHEERRGAFLVGVFVSMVSKHQREERDVSRTFMDRYDMSDITPSQLMQFMPEILSKDRIYAQEQGRDAPTVAPGIRERLPEYLATAEPTDWDITPVQFRYFYSLGTAYGEDASYAAGAEMNSSDSE